MKTYFYCTRGVHAFCEEHKCFWLLDLIMSYQSQMAAEEFQVWRITVVDSRACVKCTDGNDNELVTQYIEYTDFPLDEATLWVEMNVALLPSEH